MTRIYNIKALLPYTEEHEKNGKSTVYGSRIDVVNNGETDIKVHGITILPNGFYSFQYPENYIINDDLFITFPSDPTNSEGKNKCLVVVYKPSKDIIEL